MKRDYSGTLPHDPTLAFHRDVHLVDPVHQVVLAVHLAQVGDQLLIAELPVCSLSSYEDRNKAWVVHGCDGVAGCRAGGR